ncbi:hypothetical protein [Hymenobacter wooponensis]|uniref:Uncharacterized protein n=1 Tax=Hymenobacter wooponensis TaxID=1525360 RepID=A0A4Z0MQE3_9BACT|nr:hypothetical protein [Hymenobacter wooponensis]TGD81754.1 hypothetical protein EU557_09475 [Hymenobacter wooponensis]
MQLLKRLSKECLLALSVIIPTTIGLGYALGAPFFQLAPLDIQMHNTYLVVRPTNLVLLVSLPLWLLAQLVRVIWHLLRRLVSPTSEI